MASQAAASKCTVVQIRAGVCPPSATVGPNEVELYGTESRGGNNPARPTPPRQSSDDDGMTANEIDQYFADQRAEAERQGRTWREPFSSIGPPDAPVAPITLDDIATFRPVIGGSGMEPNGWIVTGLDTNFFSSAGTHVVTGVLLDAPAAVRFTPRSWLFDYGDGSSARTATGGASWAVLGVREFDPTATSHVYASPGTFTIDIAVQFGAEYSLDGQGWTAISGTLSVPAARFTATAGDAKTVLVARDCLANPSGPGC